MAIISVMAWSGMTDRLLWSGRDGEIWPKTLESFGKDKPHLDKKGYIDR